MADAVRRSEVLSPGPAEALSAVLGVPAPDVESGASLPLLWHWLYLLERPDQQDLGPDGHPVRGSVISPPGSGMRRMWAGGRVRALGPLRCGELTTKVSRVVTSEEKVGKSGTLTFVTVEHEIFQRNEVVVSEHQNIVYVPITSVSHPESPAEEPVTVPATSDEWSIDTSPTLLFRFSALTFNAHRIHYDRDYARDVEGHPGLIVHGPLQAIAMAERARAQGAHGHDFSYRLLAPLFESDGMYVRASVGTDPDVLLTQVRRADGKPTAEGKLHHRH